MSAAIQPFRGLDGAGDWQWGQGLSSYATNTDAIALDTQTRLLMFFGDCFFAQLFGIQWFQLLSSKNPAAQNGILLQTRQMIIGTVGGYSANGVAAINGVDFFYNPTTRNFFLQYNVVTVFSTSFAGSVTVPANLVP